MNQFFEHLRCGKTVDLRGRVAFFEAEFPTIGDDCRSGNFDKASCYRGCVNTCAWMIYLWHFGFRGTVQPQKTLNKGADLALEYFGVVSDLLAKATRDVEPEAEWYSPYSEALLLATLGGCTIDRTKLSNFLNPALTVDRPDIEPALGDILLCIASSFQSSPMETAPLEERAQQSRKRRPKLLFKAWQALQGGNRAKFTSALADSTANFAKTTADDQIPLTAVAVPESILACLAYERGWTDLSFDLPIAARLATHQSLELV